MKASTVSSSAGLRAVSPTVEPGRASPAARPRSDDAFRLFTVCWAIAIIFDFASVRRWDRTPYDFALLVSAFLLLFRGGLVPMLATSALLVINVAAYSPNYSNHWLFMGLVSLGFLSAYAVVALRERHGTPPTADIYRTFVPVGGACLAALYFYVVFHKLNTGFFDLERSAAVEFWHAQADRFPFLPRGRNALQFSIYSTLVIEALIPVLLLIRRTRLVGLALGTAFHGFIALSPIGRFWDFSSMLFALFALYAPASTLGFWWERLQAWRPGPWPRLRGWPALALLLASALFAAMCASPIGRELATKPFVYLWLVYWGLFTVLVLAPMVLDRLNVQWVPPGQPSAALAIAPLLVLLNGLCPYLGLKTESSFGMFSNLQTENGRTNHLFMPAWQPFGYQREVVQVTDSSLPYLREVIADQRLLTHFELRELARRFPQHSVTYVHQGNVHELPNMGRHGGRLPSPTAAESWFLRFRKFWIDGSSRHSH